MKRQKIFYYFKGVKVEVKPCLEVTKFLFKLDKRDVFIVMLPLEDSEIAREVVNQYINRLSLN